MLKRLIPNGTERSYTVQEIWDAHAHVFRALGAEGILKNPRVINQFKMMANEIGQPLKIVIPHSSRFQPGNGWPLIVTDPKSGRQTAIRIQ